MTGMDIASIGFLMMMLAIIYVCVKEGRRLVSDILITCGFITAIIGAIIEILGEAG